jgi:hypothetical protein
MPRMRAKVLVFALTLAAAGCGGPVVDLTENLKVLDISTGWQDDGVVDGDKNKLVPRAQFKLQNNSDQTLTVLQVNAVFRRLNEAQELGAQFKPVTSSEGLAPGQTSPDIVVKSNFGYKGTEPRAVILQNSHFVDAKVEIFAKYGSQQWKRIAEYPIERKLIER